jgi:hypothetical protein
MKSRKSLISLAAIPVILICMIANAQPGNQVYRNGVSQVKTIGIGQQPTDDLTGLWGCNDGGYYYIRQIGNVVWWYGVDSRNRNSPSFANVFYGTITRSSPGDIITGKWADVPEGRTSSSGTLKLMIETNNKLAAMQQTGGFGGTSWTRPI